MSEGLKASPFPIIEQHFAVARTHPRGGVIRPLNSPSELPKSKWITATPLPASSTQPSTNLFGNASQHPQRSQFRRGW
jgi:hypothetical protein